MRSGLEHSIKYHIKTQYTKHGIKYYRQTHTKYCNLNKPEYHTQNNSNHCNQKQHYTLHTINRSSKDRIPYKTSHLIVHYTKNDKNDTEHQYMTNQNLTNSKSYIQNKSNHGNLNNKAHGTLTSTNSRQQNKMQRKTNHPQHHRLHTG